MRWTLDAMAAHPRWPLERILALPGRVRGNAFRNWGVQVNQRFGPGSADKVRAAMELSATQFPDSPTKKDWFPVHTQIRLTQSIIDVLLHGDARGFESVFEESTGAADKALVLAGRMTGPGVVLRMAGTYHESVCDVGRCLPSVSSGQATLDFQGAELFADPTWRFGNMMGMQTMFTSLKRKLSLLEGEDSGPQGFKIHMRW